MADSEQQADAPGGQGPGGQPSEEEMRRRLEEQLRQVRVQDLLLESVASILNLSARRITKEDERDLEQARLGIDAVRAVVDMLEPDPRKQVQSALSELQMLYARETQGGEAGGGGEPEAPAGGPGEAPGTPAQERPAGGRGPGLWTPPGST